MEIQLAKKLKCKRCGHRWMPRVENVLLCPRCKSPYWNKDKVFFRKEEFLETEKK
ncbi:hypothetical protein ES705_39012 [subsurface metagenome]